MAIEIKRPEIEALIQQRLHSGAFESVEDVLFDALEMQSEREVWLQENKEAINARSSAEQHVAAGEVGTFMAFAGEHRPSLRRHPPTRPESGWRLPVQLLRADNAKLPEIAFGLRRDKVGFHEPERSASHADLSAARRVRSWAMFFSVYQYMIVYRRTELVEIVAVLRGKRDVKRLLKTRTSL